MSKKKFMGAIVSGVLHAFVALPFVFGSNKDKKSDEKQSMTLIKTAQDMKSHLPQEKIVPIEKSDAQDMNTQQITKPESKQNEIQQKTQTALSGQDLLRKLDQDEMFLLTRAYLPILKLNEGEKLHFYRCSAEKVTVGYGSNIQDNPSLLEGINVYHNKQLLSEQDKQTFVHGCVLLSKSELEKYTISKEDAEKMALKSMKTVISSLKQMKSFNFDTLPLPMQILAMDISYNIGSLTEYKKLRAGLNARNWDQVSHQYTVYTNLEKREVNRSREARKEVWCKIEQLKKSNQNLQYSQVLTELQQRKSILTPDAQSLLKNSTEVNTLKTLLYFCPTAENICTARTAQQNLTAAVASQSTTSQL